ncbi:aminotransferase class IV family protein [Brucella intermedia]|uniref:aminotransferase class IV family protein n=1 Tax=Brucella intermedia TaxID=94625 RepID=UPI00209A8A84|nr:aminotransferase class IV family protein [Brucella intermedia]MCO7737810.1 aminotransferase class IV family protein [Brucella intermedia]WLF98785.1 aminotransferase class IV family protein [Brucella intermedia]
MSSESTVRGTVEPQGAQAVTMEPDYQLIETMRSEPLSGILRFDLHMARLENSARELGFACNMEAIRPKVAEAGAGEQALKLRLTLAPDGVATVSSAPYEPLPSQTIWRVAIARTHLNHNDPLLRHKTTRRQAYIAAREEYSPAEIDEVILLNDRGEVCEGTITSIFLDIGGAACMTPALSCGLLDGVLRRELLNDNVVEEGIVTVETLKNARNILVGNSLRGMIRAKLVDL